jgi:glucose-1-phosphate adenylyltransferase
MQDQTITFILAGGDGQRLNPFTADVPKSLVTFGGVFRILDFALSNVLNGQFRKIYVLTQYRHERVQAYIREGWPQLSKEFRWDRGEDLTCLSSTGGRRYRGAADAVFQNLGVLEKSGARHVLIVPGDPIFQIDFDRMLRFHIENRADLTTAFEGVYIFRRETLIAALQKFVGQENEESFEGRILSGIARSGRVMDYPFTGYLRTIGTLDDYHVANMDFLTDRPGFDPYAGIPSSFRTLSGTTQLQQPRWTSASRVSLAARVVGSKVSQCVISTGVRVGNGSEIDSSVILAGCLIGQGCRIRNTIIAENVTIPANTEIGFNSRSDRERYSVTPEGVVIVGTPDRERHQYVQRRCARVATKAHVTVR